MLWVPQKGVVRSSRLFSSGTTTGASASTKGVVQQLTASTAFDAHLVHIIARSYQSAGAASQGCLDILIGDATESVLIANLLMGYCHAFNFLGKSWTFPLYIPAGSRISAQAAGARVSTSFVVDIRLYNFPGIPPFRVGSRVTTYGVSSVPDGTSITPGESGADGAWTQIVASTSENHFALVPSFQPTGDSTLTARSYALELAVGAAADETLISEVIGFGADAAEGMVGPNVWLPTFVEIPSGNRLSARVSNSGTNDAGYNGAIHAVS